MRRAAAPSRQPSSSRGGWLAHQERGLLAAQRGSQADPTGFQPVCSSPGGSKRRLRGFCGLAPLRLWGHPRSAWQGRTRSVGEGRLRRGMAGVQDRHWFASYRARPLAGSRAEGIPGSDRPGGSQTAHASLAARPASRSWPFLPSKGCPPPAALTPGSIGLMTTGSHQLWVGYGGSGPGRRRHAALQQR